MTKPTTTIASDAGILAGLGLEEVPDHLPDGTYPAYLTEAKVINLKDNKGQSLVFTYKVDLPGSQINGETIDEFKSINPADDNQKKKFLKMRLESLGVPSTRFAQFNPKDVVGLAVTITVKTKGQYTNVTNVTLRNESGSASATVTSVPAITSVSTSALTDLL